MMKVITIGKRGGGMRQFQSNSCSLLEFSPIICIYNIHMYIYSSNQTNTIKHTKYTIKVVLIPILKIKLHKNLDGDWAGD